MQHVKRTLAVVVVLFAASAVLFASGQKQKSGAEGTGEEVSLTFWNMPFVTQEVSPEYVSLWEDNVADALANATVEDFYGPGGYSEQRQNFLVQAESGTPDVIEGLLEDVSVYESRGVIEPLTSYFEQWDESDQFIESTLEPLRINGELWGIPYNTNARALVVRTDVLDEYGLEVPETWSELIQTARTITEESGGDMYGLMLTTAVGGPRAAQEFISWLYQANGGEQMFNVSGDDVTLNTDVETLEQVLTFYDQAFAGDNPAVSRDQRGAGWEVEDPGYVNGQWAMAPMGPWLWGRRGDSDQAATILEQNTDVVALPIPEGGTPATYLEVKAIMMNTHAENKDQAWNLIKYITSQEMMARWLIDSGGIPPRTDSFEMDVFQEAAIGQWLQGFADQVPNAIALAPINWGPVNEANLRAVNFVIYDQRDPADAAQWLHDQITSLIEAGEL